jgi:DNA-binding HxlR family transcriptional regulator/CheY-like chemotaxis protein
MDDTDLADSVARSLLGTKWKPRIVVALARENRLGFGDLQRELDGISNKVLSNNLEDLGEYDVLVKDVVQQQPVRVEYELTSAGHELYDLVASMAAWDESYVDGVGLPTVLLADDDVRQLELYTTWLSVDYDVVTVTDGRKALDALDGSVDAAVLDRNMPVLRGEEVAETVAGEGSVPVGLLSSAQPDPSDVDSSADLLLSKPVGSERLGDAVAELLRLGEASSVAREVRAREHRLAFVRTELGQAVEDVETYRAAKDELDRLVEERQRELEDREPWRRLADVGADTEKEDDVN